MSNTKLVPRAFLGIKSKAQRQQEYDQRRADLVEIYGIDNYNRLKRQLESMYDRSKQSMTQKASELRNQRLKRESENRKEDTQKIYNSNLESIQPITDEIDKLRKNLPIITKQYERVTQESPKSDTSSSNNTLKENSSTTYEIGLLEDDIDNEEPTSTTNDITPRKVGNNKYTIDKSLLNIPSVTYKPSKGGGNFGGGTTAGGGASGSWGEPEPKKKPKKKKKQTAVIQKTTERTFNDAFAQARKQGLKEFEFNGKKYTTELGNNPNSQRVGNARKEITSELVGIIPINKNGNKMQKLVPKAFLGIKSKKTQYWSEDVGSTYPAGPYLIDRSGTVGDSRLLRTRFANQERYVAPGLTTVERTWNEQSRVVTRLDGSLPEGTIYSDTEMIE